LAAAVHLHNIVIDLLMLTAVGRRVTEIQSLDASLGIELGGAALALGIHRGCPFAPSGLVSSSSLL